MKGENEHLKRADPNYELRLSAWTAKLRSESENASIWDRLVSLGPPETPTWRDRLGWWWARWSRLRFGFYFKREEHDRWE